MTMGDPAGIGPEVIAKSMASQLQGGLAIFAVIGDTAVMSHQLERFFHGEIRTFKRDEAIDLTEGAVNVIDPGCPLSDIQPGVPTEEGSGKAIESLSLAVDIMQGSPRKDEYALVTAPLSKEHAAKKIPGFVGHTEFLQDRYKAEMVTMVFVGDNLCAVPVTRHIPLKDVPRMLTRELILKTLLQVAQSRKLITGKEDASILVCALNPHAGEGGSIGREEIEIIAPAVEEAKLTYSNIEGPVPADAAFHKAYSKKADIVVSMYHDQCLGPFKMLDFDTGVNMTLGLGQVRTSPDHGTAFDIAGKGIASPGSMERAIELAIRAITMTDK